MANLLGPIKVVSTNKPRKPVYGVNYTITYDPNLGNLVFTELTPVDATGGLDGWVIRLPGGTLMGLPRGNNTILFNPTIYPDNWLWNTPTWNLSVQIAGQSDIYGLGLYSNPTDVVVDQSATYYVENWTYTELRDQATAGGIPGRQIITTPDFAVPNGFALHRYSGPLPYVSDNYAAIHNSSVSPVIAANTTVTTTTGGEIGTTFNGVLLWEDLTLGIWTQAGPQRSFTVQGIINDALPTFSVNPAITGTGKIGTDLTLSFAHNGTGETIVWQGNGTAIPGADDLTYSVLAGDDVKNLRAVVTPFNLSGNGPSVASNQIQATHVAPAVVTPMDDHSYEQETGANRSIDFSDTFSGSSLTYTLVTPVSGVTLNAANESLSVNIGALLTETAVTVRATNSGGDAEDTTLIEVTAVSGEEKPTFIAAYRSTTDAFPEIPAAIAGDMVYVWVKRNVDEELITVPDLAGFTGDYDWHETYNLADPVNAGAGTDGGGSAAAAWRKVEVSGPADFITGLGTFTNAQTFYVEVWRHVSSFGTPTVIWEDANSTTVTYPSVPVLGSNSAVISFASLVSGVTGQAPGLRTDADNGFLNTGSGIRARISHTKAAEIPVSIHNAQTVDDLVTTGVHVEHFASSVEVRGVESSTLIWPDYPDASLFVVSIVTDPAEAAANGFPGVSGHIKAVIDASIDPTQTTASGDFSLRQSFREGTDVSPANTNAQVATGTFYGTTPLTVGDTARGRFYWKFGTGDTAQYKLVVETPEFTVEALDETDPDISFPALSTAGMTEIRARPNTTYNLTQNGLQNNAYSGPGMFLKGYSAWRGTSADRASLIAEMKHTLVGNNGPKGQHGFASQMEGFWVAGAYFISQDPESWAGLTGNEKLRLDALMRLEMITGAACIRTNLAGEATLNMIGFPNRAGEDGHGNPNFRMAPRAVVMMCAAYMGGAAAGEAYLNSVDADLVAALRTELTGYGMTQAAASIAPTGRPSGAPSITQLVGKCNNCLIDGYQITNPSAIWRVETEFSFDQVVTSGLNGGAGASDGQGKFIGSVTSYAPYLAIAGLVGMSHEMNTVDGEGQRASPTYAEWAIRVALYYTAVMLASGMISPADPTLNEAFNRMRIGNEFQRIAMDRGYDGYAHGGGNGSTNWTWALDASQNWCTTAYRSMGDAIATIHANAT